MCKGPMRGLLVFQGIQTRQWSLSEAVEGSLGDLVLVLGLTIRDVLGHF